MRPTLALSLILGQAYALDRTLGFNAKPTVENRTLDQIYEAAVAEGGVVTLWHGGDERNQMDFLKDAFEKRFPKMKLNLTVDLSKYHDGRIDQQLAAKNVFVDSVMLQTVHDFPRWAREGALMNYAPLGFDQIHPAFKDSVSASWYGVELLFWQNAWNTKKLPNANFSTFDSFLRPEFKNKLVLTYPHDDDAVLFAFDQIMQQQGEAWFDKLLAQNPKWVRGTATPFTLISQPNSTVAATFTTAIGFTNVTDIATALPTDGLFVSWAQRGGILNDAPHPEGAKLLHSFMLSPEFQKELGWSVRQDVEPPAGVPDLMRMPNTNPVAFNTWMEDRPNVERLRFWFEDRIGTAQGKSPLVDGI
ncbi:ABC-type Fe3+ transport system [Pochonia chlamydosporia 170]|uniref:ABC-type Fe3+ transport system n=1 Tax=Pochonia chlamydosporia 170 TaxID=1380566 RepID=A0A179FIK9_METCM|nr:ABC-type Fe3+ transport system [Pochonia chlamydosporia 170]OAQ65120.1 ABC-type Fe3+ transport system [Pochonia chlamydosporia 170]